MDDLRCTNCAKKLSRKTARLIEGKLLCSACLFPKTKRGSYEHSGRSSHDR
jgi:formylmethanofuran dehydrogenase subunit E